MRRYAKKIVYIFFAIFLSFTAFKEYLFYSEENKLSLSNTIKLQSGDIILRRESNRISDIFAQINNSKYSHIGTVLIIKNTPKVVHIEDTGDNKDYKIHAIDDFIRFASHYAIYRPTHPTNEEKLFSFVKSIETQKPSFDMEFSGNTDDNKIYCTELAYMLNKTSTMFDIHPMLMSYINYRFIPITSFADARYFELLFEF